MEPDPKSGIKPNPKLGVKTWGQCGHEKKKKKKKWDQNFLGFVSQDTSIVFIVKVAYDMEMVKIAEITKTYGGNTKSGLERGLQLLYIYFIRYI